MLIFEGTGMEFKRRIMVVKRKFEGFFLNSGF